MMVRACAQRLGMLIVVGLASVALGACGGNDGGKSDRTSTTVAPPASVTSPTTTSPTAASGAATPEAAIAAFLASRGQEYIGDCSGSDVATDVGKYCSLLQEDRGDTRSYLIGPVAAEGETIVVARHGQVWELVVPGP
ncbi:MAG: hypothetical protein MUP97_08610 [Acidimicrobiia bacterium]|nr:hypothetical protein [Acidimicrobiia bacterium]